MKITTRLLAFAGALALCASAAFGQSYPVTNPTYIPTATGPSCTITAAASCVMTTQGLGTVSVRVAGTNGGFAATIKGSNDGGTTYTTLSAVPVAGGAAVTSQSANGFWLVNAAGMNKVEFITTSVTSGSLTVTMAGTQSAAGVNVTDITNALDQTPVAAGTATATKGVLLGGQYDSTQKTLTNGQQAAISASARGAIMVATGADTFTVADSSVVASQTPVAAGTATATNGVLIGGQYDSTQKTLTNGQQAAVSASARGALMVATGADAFNVVTTQTSTVGDPCLNPSVLKSSAVINVGAAATTKIVDTSSSTVVYVCGFSATLAGTTPTVVFKTGTHVTNDCDTGAASLTGIYAPVTGSDISASGMGTVMKSTAGGQICATTVGTGSSFQGVLTYVQQ